MTVRFGSLAITQETLEFSQRRAPDHKWRAKLFVFEIVWENHAPASDQYETPPPDPEFPHEIEGELAD